MTQLLQLWPNIPMGTPCTSNTRSTLLSVKLARHVASASKLPAKERLAVCGTVLEPLPYLLPARRVSGIKTPISCLQLLLSTPLTPQHTQPELPYLLTSQLMILAASMVTGPAKAPPNKPRRVPGTFRTAIVSCPRPPRRTCTPLISDLLLNSPVLTPRSSRLSSPAMPTQVLPTLTGAPLVLSTWTPSRKSCSLRTPLPSL